MERIVLLDLGLAWDDVSIQLLDPRIISVRDEILEIAIDRLDQLRVQLVEGCPVDYGLICDDHLLLVLRLSFRKSNSLLEAILGRLQVVDVYVRAVKVSVARHGAILLSDLSLEAELAVPHRPHKVLLSFLRLLFICQRVQGILLGLLGIDHRGGSKVLDDAILNLQEVHSKFLV